jgi:hypothetical protein
VRPTTPIATASIQTVCDLTAKSSHRTQHAQLTLPIDDRHGERVHDSENGHDDRDEHLAVGQLQPLIGELQHPAAHFGIRQHQHSRLVRREALEDPPSDVVRLLARFDINPNHVDGVVLPVPVVYRAIEEHRPLLVGPVRDDADDRQRQESAGSRELDAIATCLP